MEAEIIDLCDSDDDDKSTINLVGILPSIPPAPVGPPSAPRRNTTNNVEKSFLNSSTGIPEAERLIAECSLCDGVFNSTAAFVSHMQSYHRLSNLFECTSCHQIFISQVGLKYHMDTVHPPTQASLPRTTCLSCDICGDKFKFQEALDAHKEVHTVEKKFSIVAENLDNETESKKYTCPICLKKFFVEKALLLHRKKKHVILRKGRPKSAPLTSDVMMKVRSKGGIFTCDVCSKVYPAKKNLMAHRRWHFRKDPSLIDKRLTSQSLNENLISPVIRQKPTSESKQTELIQSCASNLMQTSEPAKPKEFPCNNCERIFFSKHGLGRHMSWHIKRAKRVRGSQRQMATRRSTKSVTKEGLTNNLKISIQLFPNNEAKIKSSILNDDYKEIPVSESEGDSSLPEFSNNPANSSKAFECNFCSEKFLYCYNYRQHMETHRKKKNLCCHTCGEFFAFKCSLQTHEYTQHSSEKLSFCKLCHRPFIDKYSLQAHYRSCYLISCKVQKSVSKEKEEQINLNSTTANPMPANQSLSSSADMAPSKFREPHRSINSTHSESSPMPSDQFLSSSADMTASKFRESCKSTSSIYRVANPVPLNQPLSSSADPTPSKFREPIKSINSTYSESHSYAGSPSLFDKGYYYCNICEKKYSSEIRLLHHVLMMHSSENYPFDPPPYSQQVQDSPNPSIEENFEDSFLNFSSPPYDSNDSSQNQDLFNREGPVECSDPLSLDPLNEPLQRQGTHDSEQNSFQNLAPSNPMPLNLSVSCDQVAAMRAFSEYLVTVDRMSLKPTSVNNNNSDLSLHSLQEHRNF